MDAFETSVHDRYVAERTVLGTEAAAVYGTRVKVLVPMTLPVVTTVSTPVPPFTFTVVALLNENTQTSFPSPRSRVAVLTKTPVKVMLSYPSPRLATTPIRPVTPL